MLWYTGKMIILKNVVKYWVLHPDHINLDYLQATTTAVEAGSRTAYSGTVRGMYGTVQLHISGRYNNRRDGTKSKLYPPGGCRVAVSGMSSGILLKQNCTGISQIYKILPR